MQSHDLVFGYYNCDSNPEHICAKLYSTVCNQPTLSTKLRTAILQSKENWETSWGRMSKQEWNAAVVGLGRWNGSHIVATALLFFSNKQRLVGFTTNQFRGVSGESNKVFCEPPFFFCRKKEKMILFPFSQIILCSSKQWKARPKPHAASLLVITAPLLDASKRTQNR